MTAIIPNIIAGISTIAFLSLWFVTSYRELSHKKQEVVAAAEQVKMHRTLRLKECGSSNRQAAKRMLDTSYMIYMETVKGYNSVLKKPINRFPGFIMGFRLIPETKPPA